MTLFIIAIKQHGITVLLIDAIKHYWLLAHPWWLPNEHKNNINSVSEKLHIMLSMFCVCDGNGKQRTNKHWKSSSDNKHLTRCPIYVNHIWVALLILWHSMFLQVFWKPTIYEEYNHEFFNTHKQCCLSYVCLVTNHHLITITGSTELVVFFGQNSLQNENFNNIVCLLLRANNWNDWISKRIIQVHRGFTDTHDSHLVCLCVVCLKTFRELKYDRP